MSKRVLALFMVLAAFVGGALATVDAKDVREWSTTAASNNDASPDGAPENMAPSGVNDTIRENMAAIAEWYATSYGRNRLINGGFSVSQRGTSFTSTDSLNNDDVYTLDRWTLLSDGNDIVDVSQETTTVPTGSYAAIKLDVETADKKFGIVQIIEARDAASLIGGTGSLSFKARVTGSTIGEIRAGAACWSSTADSVTSDVVSAWGGAGTNPTLAANWTFENTPADLTNISTSYQTYRIENISFDTSSCVNIAVFIWTDDVTMDVGDFLYIAEVQLEPGPVATSFEREAFSVTLEKSLRYFERIGGDGSVATRWSAGGIRSTTVADAWVRYSRKRTAPSVTVTSSTAITFIAQATGHQSTSVSFDQASVSSARATVTKSGGGLTAGNAAVFYFTATTDSIDVSSEL